MLLRLLCFVLACGLPAFVGEARGAPDFAGGGAEQLAVRELSYDPPVAAQGSSSLLAAVVEIGSARSHDERSREKHDADRAHGSAREATQQGYEYNRAIPTHVVIKCNCAGVHATTIPPPSA